MTISNLTKVKLLFLPPDRYSVLQPTDQGVIRSLKAQYRRLVVRMCIKALDKNQPLPKISILQAITTLVSSWSAVPPHVIIKCFSKAGISDSSQQVALTEEDNPFKELIRWAMRNTPWRSTRKRIGCNFFAVDDHVIVPVSVATDTEILSQILDNNNDSDDEIAIKEKNCQCVLRKGKQKTLWKLCRIPLCMPLSMAHKCKI